MMQAAGPLAQAFQARRRDGLRPLHGAARSPVLQSAEGHDLRGVNEIQRNIIAKATLGVGGGSCSGARGGFGGAGVALGVV
jgi:hypothetical protein